VSSAMWRLGSRYGAVYVERRDEAIAIADAGESAGMGLEMASYYRSGRRVGWQFCFPLSLWHRVSEVTGLAPESPRPSPQSNSRGAAGCSGASVPVTARLTRSSSAPSGLRAIEGAGVKPTGPKVSIAKPSPGTRPSGNESCTERSGAKSSPAKADPAKTGRARTPRGKAVHEERRSANATPVEGTAAKARRMTASAEKTVSVLPTPDTGSTPRGTTSISSPRRKQTDNASKSCARSRNSSDPSAPARDKAAKGLAPAGKPARTVSPPSVTLGCTVNASPVVPKRTRKVSAAAPAQITLELDADPLPRTASPAKPTPRTRTQNQK